MRLCNDYLANWVRRRAGQFRDILSLCSHLQHSGDRLFFKRRPNVSTLFYDSSRRIPFFQGPVAAPTLAAASSMLGSPKEWRFARTVHQHRSICCCKLRPLSQTCLFVGRPSFRDCGSALCYFRPAVHASCSTDWMVERLFEPDAMRPSCLRCMSYGELSGSG
ncbi:hypothetical protein M011DRAFT_302932 [Sporormia fimetaria CBS 119925]|uniref:Uncharacterized protein n=1 Tax=Sporormia fimetaria CBS 119925 TaxID=1340428 RepID=A0A6A6VHT5_9PLEO|nr:hypothetical protein M011DRAFT_302932 [Sporormia fimetaria CBS 119925]